MKWKLLPTLYWIAWIVAFGVWETIAGFDKKHDIPMLTQFIVRYIPGWITMPTLFWLVWHFGSRYLTPAYVEWLKTGAK